MQGRIKSILDMLDDGSEQDEPETFRQQAEPGTRAEPAVRAEAGPVAAPSGECLADPMPGRSGMRFCNRRSAVDA